MSWALLRGDCLQVMRALRAESVDAIVCDPPYYWAQVAASETAQAELGL